MYGSCSAWVLQTARWDNIHFFQSCSWSLGLETSGKREDVEDMRRRP
jgi:hypothetical protein